MKGFKIICSNCQTQSEFNNEHQRLLEDILVLKHHNDVRFVCTKCEEQLVLKN